jgi:hypothetical protein
LFEEMVLDVGVESTRHAFNGGGFSSYFGFRRRRICDVRSLEHAFTVVLRP